MDTVRKLKSELEGRGNDFFDSAKYRADYTGGVTESWMKTNARGTDAFILAIQLS